MKNSIDKDNLGCGCLACMLMFPIVLLCLIGMLLSMDSSVGMLLGFGAIVVFFVFPMIVFIIAKRSADENKKPYVLKTKVTGITMSPGSMDAYKLANVLKGKAPADVLEHCDSIMHNSVLLETYIMQCENNGRISSWTANFLRESYKKAIERVKISGAQNNFSQISQSVPSHSVTTRDLERVYHNVYNAVPNLQCVDRLCKLFGGENFCSKICDSTPFCRMIFAENQSKDLLDYIYIHNKSAAYLCCIDVLRKQSGQKH